MENRASLLSLSPPHLPPRFLPPIPPLQLLRCLFSLQSPAVVAVWCNLVLPLFSMLPLNGKAHEGLQSLIFHSSSFFPSFYSSLQSYFLPVTHTLVQYTFISFLFPPPFISILYHNVGSSHMLALLDTSDTILGRGVRHSYMRHSYSTSSVVYICRL